MIVLRSWIAVSSTYCLAETTTFSSARSWPVNIMVVIRSCISPAAIAGSLSDLIDPSKRCERCELSGP